MAKPNALAIPSKLIAVGPAGANPPIAAAPQPKNTKRERTHKFRYLLIHLLSLRNLSRNPLAGRFVEEFHLFRFPIIGRDPFSQLNFRHNRAPEREVRAGPLLTSLFLFASRNLARLRFAVSMAKQLRRPGDVATTRR